MRFLAEYGKFDHCFVIKMVKNIKRPLNIVAWPFFFFCVLLFIPNDPDFTPNMFLKQCNKTLFFYGSACVHF